MAGILLVDDDESTGQLLRMILSDSGTGQIERVTRGRDALKVLEESAHDLVIVDLHLPDIDGVTLIQEARALGYAGAVLVLSGSSERDPLMVRLRSEVQGVSFLKKPFDLDEVIRRVSDLLPPEPAHPEAAAPTG